MGLTPQFAAFLPRFRIPSRMGLHSQKRVLGYCQFFVSLMFRLRRRDNGGPKFPFLPAHLPEGNFGANGACGAGGTQWLQPDS